MKFKALLLASVVAFSGSAHAAIPGTSGAQATDTSLVVMIYDTVKDLSFIQDLGSLYLEDVVAANGNFSGSYSLDASALSIFATSDKNNLVWNLTAANGDGVFNEDTGEYDGTKKGLITTGGAGKPQSLSDSQIAGIAGKFNQLAQTANQYLTGGVTAVSKGTASALSAAVGVFVDRFSKQVSSPNAAKASVAQNLWFDHTDINGDTAPVTLASQNAWVLDLNNLGNATLSSTPSVSQVPLPAAAWLMLSALFGLGGIARRRNV